MGNVKVRGVKTESIEAEFGADSNKNQRILRICDNTIPPNLELSNQLIREQIVPSEVVNLATLLASHLWPNWKTNLLAQV